MSLPAWLSEKLASPPTAGAGVHAWLFSTARQLHAHMEPAAIEAVLALATAHLPEDRKRGLQREIRDAVRNSRAVAWERKEGVVIKQAVNRHKSLAENGAGVVISETPGEAWPAVDAAAKEQAIMEAHKAGVPSVYDLCERSPSLPNWSADDWLDWLFPGAEWLCLAVDHPATARSRRPEKWYFGPADECGLVVPSPMTGPSGKRQDDGKTAHRCLDNTGPRKWLVIEFDKTPIDDQAALHWHFRALSAGWPKLRLVVHSGGKSLHGWYGPVESEEAALELMTYAVLLGADHISWNRSQLMRLPGGRRATKPHKLELPEWVEPGEFTPLSVLFFDPHPSA